MCVSHWPELLEIELLISTLLSENNYLLRVSSSLSRCGFPLSELRYKDIMEGWGVLRGAGDNRRKSEGGSVIA